MPKLRLVFLVLTLSVGLLVSPALSTRAQDDPPADLIILTYNVLYTNTDLQAISEIIRTSGADLVLIQEVTADLARDLPPLVADIYPYAAMHVAVRRRLGLGAFSRFPFLLEAFRSDLTLDSSSLYLQIDLDGAPVTVYNVHLANPLTGFLRYDASQHAPAVSWLLDQLDALPAGDHAPPLIVAGDLNFADFSADYTCLADRLTDSFAELDNGFFSGYTFPADAPFPLLRLDYVFHSAHFATLSARVGGSSGGSDHYPLRVELDLAQ